MAREHHFFFAKKLIPGQVFQSTERMFAELTGAQREAFVFFLWTEAGKQCKEALPHVGVAPGAHELSKLDVVGRIASGGTEVVVLSMPPALEANEALFVAPVRGNGRLSVFFYERCRDDAGTGVNASEAVLAEARADGSRVNHGFKQGLDLAAFKRHLGEALGISLDGLETSLPAVTAEAFVAAGGGPGSKKGKGAGVSGNPYAAGGGGGGGGGGGARPGGLLESLLLLRWGLPLVLFAVSRVLPALVYPLWGIIGYVYTALSVAIGISLLVWLYQVYDLRRGQAPFSPGMAVGGWFIPIANMILPPMIVAGAYRSVVGSSGALLALAWWVFYLLEIVKQMQISMIEQGVVLPLPPDVFDLLMTLWGPPWGLLIVVGAYGILWHIVRSVRAKL